MISNDEITQKNNNNSKQLEWLTPNIEKLK
jgi:hypothetical protein